MRTVEVEEERVGKVVVVEEYETDAKGNTNERRVAVEL